MKKVKDLNKTAGVKDNNLKAVDKVNLNYNTAYKYEPPYKDPFVLTHCLTNGMVT